MYKVKVNVSLRESILDPAGTAVAGSLQKLGFSEVKSVRMGKTITLTIDSTQPEEAVKAQAAEMCEKLLANTVIEDYQIELEKI